MKKKSTLFVYVISIFLHTPDTINAAQPGIYKEIYLGGEIPQCVPTQFNLTEMVFNEKSVYQGSRTFCNNQPIYIYYYNNHWGLTNASPNNVDGNTFTKGINSEWPWDSIWHNGAVITPIRIIEVVGNINFKQCSLGNYFFSSEVYNDKPIYRKLESPCFGKEWYLYADTEGHWSIGYNDPHASSHYRVSKGIKSAWPWDKVWPEGVAVAIKYFHD